MQSISTRLEKLMLQIPELDSYGIWSPHNDRKLPLEERLKEHEENRARLRREVHSVEATIKWLTTNITPIKTISKRRTSYGMKHIVEKEIGYITNGTFIAAAILAGYTYVINPEWPNVSFGMSEKSLKAAEKRLKGVTPPL